MVKGLKQYFRKASHDAQPPMGQGSVAAEMSDLMESIPFLEEKDFPETPPALNSFPLAFMKRFCFLPLEETDASVTVVMADPLDFSTREALQKTYNKPVQLCRADAETITQFIYRWHEAEVDMAGDAHSEDLELSIEDQLWDSPEHLKDMASEAPIIRLVNHLIARAMALDASDIHIEPRKAHLQIRYRIDGVLHDQESISKKLKAAITSRVKLIAKMDIAEMRLPQDGRIKFKVGREEVDIRVSSVPTHFGESLVLRLLKQENVRLSLDLLGFPEKVKQQFEKVITLPYGMVLVTGPTGSGKTTTLYAALNTINSPDVKIVTVEDPVEYQMEGVNQVQVQNNIELTFARCLRSFLRQDPDVILVGEIRDLETADIAVQAALTGHMVFSTLHTNDASGAITRMEDLGVERFMVASAVVAVLAQRLVRKVCPECSEAVQLNDAQRKRLAKDLDVDESVVVSSYRRGKGCKECGETGYRGRVGIYEFLPINEPMQREIARGAGRNAIFEKAVALGMVSLRADGIDKVRQGITTYEEVLRVTR